jgi:hypothetical protein
MLSAAATATTANFMVVSLESHWHSNKPNGFLGYLTKITFRRLGLVSAATPPALGALGQ